MMKRENIEDIEAFVCSRSYAEVTEAERLELNELFTSEEEFEAVKQMYLSLNAMKGNVELPELKLDVKASLDAVFAAKHPLRDPITTLEVEQDNRRKGWVNNWFVRIAAMLVVVSTTVWMFLRSETNNAENQLASNEQVMEEKSKSVVITSTDSVPEVNEATNSNRPATTMLAAPMMSENESIVAPASATRSEEVQMEMAAASRGMNADLYPERLPSAPSLAQQKSEVLDMLTPMF